jgi:hypothetical protein
LRMHCILGLCFSENPWHSWFLKIFGFILRTAGQLLFRGAIHQQILVGSPVDFFIHLGWPHFGGAGLGNQTQCHLTAYSSQALYPLDHASFPKYTLFIPCVHSVEECFRPLQKSVSWLCTVSVLRAIITSTLLLVAIK